MQFISAQKETYHAGLFFIYSRISDEYFDALQVVLIS